MLWIIFFLNLCFAQEGIWKSLCGQSSDCIGHLVCTEGLCMPPNPPTSEQCQTLSFAHKDFRGGTISMCPPDCGFEEKVVYGPRCTRNTKGCSLSTECRQDGLCGFNGEICIPTEEGCAQSLLCRTKGLCGFDGKVCVATNEGCSKSERCMEDGLCGYLPGPKDYEASHGTCVRSRSGCKKSKVCKKNGFCGFNNGLCVTNPQGCANAEICRTQSLCTHRSFVGCVR
jgi:hypothetical protein